MLLGSGRWAKRRPPCALPADCVGKKNAAVVKRWRPARQSPGKTQSTARCQAPCGALLQITWGADAAIAAAGDGPRSPGRRCRGRRHPVQWRSPPRARSWAVKPVIAVDRRRPLATRGARLLAPVGTRGRGRSDGRSSSGIQPSFERLISPLSKTGNSCIASSSSAWNPALSTARQIRGCRHCRSWQWSRHLVSTPCSASHTKVLTGFALPPPTR